ncbi:PREDICTED: aspartic proteinase-like protein 2 isoform X2 [Brassica oleracea var. oleracea]|uniref:aspartic proteinase-like protein 2 isoform X2 n=1 Tax=Brassica oleracea var. oleracea TaxID=109376 RepID=UPI0006A73947|nr:PREDICTED: aspartic proteinase-like protein 2 isoform X2 [Brassica oleracea var. oleracea]
MDLRRRQWSLSPIFLAATVVTLLFELQLSAAATENVVFEVRSKFSGKIEKDLRALKAHDAHRHSRLLSSAIDLPLGGDSWPTGQYFAKIGLGTPSRDFHVQVDTGSDLLWVNCAGCIKCPRKSDLCHSGSTYVYQTSRCFAHCLDNKNGGGIFAIGEVVSPKVKTTPMLSKSDHYSVSLTSVEVGNSVLQLSSGEEVIVDSGTTLAYLPNSVYMPLMNEILVTHPELTFHNVQDLQGSFICFRYTDDKLDRFPPVTFYFNKSASLTVYPQDYLLQLQGDAWCFGWQSSGFQTKDGRELLILGDMALSNKLVVYDIENQVMGWTNHNCSGGIQVKDEQSGSIYTVGAHNLSWSSSLAITKLLTLVSLLVHFLFYH